MICVERIPDYAARLEEAQKAEAAKTPKTRRKRARKPMKSVEILYRRGHSVEQIDHLPSTQVPETLVWAADAEHRGELKERV
jgi:hypothetical protein